MSSSVKEQESIGCDACGNKDAHLGCDFCHRSDVKYCSRECRAGLGWVKHEAECNVVRSEQLCATPYAWQNLAPHAAWEQKMQDEAVAVCNKFPSYLVKHDLPDQLTVTQTVIPAIRESKPVESEHSAEERVKDHTFEVFVNGVSMTPKKPLKAPDAMISTHSTNAAAQRLVESRIARPQSRTYWVSVAAAAAATTMKPGTLNVIELVRNGDKDRARRVEFHLPAHAQEDFAEQVQQRLGQGLKGFWQEQMRWKGLGKQTAAGISSHHAFNPDMGDGVVFTVDKELKLVDLEFYVARDPKPVRLQQQTFQKTVDDTDSNDIQALAMALEDILEENPRHEQAQLHLASLLDFFHSPQRDDAATLTKARVAIGESMSTVNDELIGKRSSDEWDQWVRSATPDMVERRIAGYANRMAKLILQREDLEVEESTREGFFRRTAARMRAAAVRRQISVLQSDIAKFEAALETSGRFGAQVTKLNRVRTGDFQELYPEYFQNRRRTRGLSKKNQPAAMQNELGYQRRIEFKVDDALIGKRSALEWEQWVFNSDQTDIGERVDSYANRLAKLIMQREDLEKEEAARENIFRRGAARVRAATVRTQIRLVQAEIRDFMSALRTRIRLNTNAIQNGYLEYELGRLRSMYNLNFRNEDWAQHYFTGRRATRGLKNKGAADTGSQLDYSAAPIGAFVQLPNRRDKMIYVPSLKEQKNDEQLKLVLKDKGIGDLKEDTLYDYVTADDSNYANSAIWEWNTAEKAWYRKAGNRKVVGATDDQKDTIEKALRAVGTYTSPAQPQPEKTVDYLNAEVWLRQRIERLKKDALYSPDKFNVEMQTYFNASKLTTVEKERLRDTYSQSILDAARESAKLPAAGVFEAEEESDDEDVPFLDPLYSLQKARDEISIMLNTLRKGSIMFTTAQFDEWLDTVKQRLEKQDYDTLIKEFDQKINEAKRQWRVEFEAQEEVVVPKKTEPVPQKESTSWWENLKSVKNWIMDNLKKTEAYEISNMESQEQEKEIHNIPLPKGVLTPDKEEGVFSALLSYIRSKPGGVTNDDIAQQAAEKFVALAKSSQAARRNDARNLPHSPGFVPSHDPSRPPPGERGNYYYGYKGGDEMENRVREAIGSLFPEHVEGHDDFDALSTHHVLSHDPELVQEIRQAYAQHIGVRNKDFTQKAYEDGLRKALEKAEKNYKNRFERQKKSYAKALDREDRSIARGERSVVRKQKGLAKREERVKQQREKNFNYGHHRDEYYGYHPDDYYYGADEDDEF